MRPSNRVSGLKHAFGFCGHGIALAPVVGPLLAELVERRTTNLLIDSFAIDRFDQRGGSQAARSIHQAFPPANRH